MIRATSLEITADDCVAPMHSMPSRSPYTTIEVVEEWKSGDWRKVTSERPREWRDGGRLGEARLLPGWAFP